MNMITQQDDLFRHIAQTRVVHALLANKTLMTSAATVGRFRRATGGNGWALYDDRPNVQRREYVADDPRGLAAAFIEIVGVGRAMEAVDAANDSRHDSRRAG